MAGSVSTRIDAVVRGALVAWVDAVRRHPGWTLTLALGASLLCLPYVALHLGVNTDMEALFDDSLPFRELHLELGRAFPERIDPLLVVIDAESGPGAREAARKVVERLSAETRLFVSAWAPGEGAFFERNGLLYLEVDELEEWVDQIAGAQPFLAEISRDPSLRGVFSPLTQALEASVPLPGLDLAGLFERVEAALEAAGKLRPRPLAVDELLLGAEGTAGEKRRYVLVKPQDDFSGFLPIREAMLFLGALLDEVEAESDRPLRLRVTGDLALNFEEMDRVQGQVTLASLASLVLVAGILSFALRSLRQILAILVSLLVGLLWTATFAAAAIGSLNLISVAFSVLFIGLGVDFGIHLCMRYRELMERNLAHPEALRETARSVGSSLVLCAITTAIGFYAFIGTGYTGVTELGVIAGTGMFISLFVSLTVLPALLSLGKQESRRPSHVSAAATSLLAFPTRHPRVVCTVAVLVGVGSAILAPRLEFDGNILRVRDPYTESVKTFDELVEGGDANPWTIEIVTTDLAEADALAARIGELPSVDRTLTLSSYIPTDQEDKLEILADAALFLNLAADGTQLPAPDAAEKLAVLRRFGGALRGFEERTGSDELREAAGRLGEEVDAFLASAEQGDAGGSVLEALDASLVQTMVARVGELATALEARQVSLDLLPDDLRTRLVTPDGRARLQVFPAENLNDNESLERFVTEVRQLAPKATGDSVYMLESARTVVDALRQAFTAAAVLVAVLLWLLWRSVRDAAFVMVPLGLAALATAASAVLTGLTLNFADVIVLPLLLGIGVDSGIHLVHRYRDATEREPDLLSTSTPRAVVWSAFTTIASFGSLAFSTHRGMASLGQLLTLGVAITVLVMVVVLPAMLALRTQRSS